MSLDRFTFTPEIEAAVSSPEETKKKREDDPRFFKAKIKDPKKPATANYPEDYQALIRILPRGLDFTKSYNVDVYTHMYSVNGQWINSKCRKMLSDREDCPICEEMWKEYNATKGINITAAKAELTKKSYNTEHICNILVIKDTINPANDGKVMLWKMPNTIFKKVKEASNKDKKEKVGAFGVASANTDPIFHPVDPIKGRNLHLWVTRDAKGMVSYDSSNWYDVKNPAPLVPLDDASAEAKIDAILKECNDLVEFVESVPTYEKVRAELDSFHSRTNRNLGGSVGSTGFEHASAGIGGVNLDANVRPAQAPVQEGNSANYFGQATVAPAPTAFTPSAPAASPFSASPEVSPEDDLPF